MFICIILNHPTSHLEEGSLRECLWDLRQHRGTIGMSFFIRRLQEECQEIRSQLYSTFVDLMKAFDTVNRDF
ncbi:unnamed protein product [Dibothriocephalus latus]|uniref:Reverse transcriptase domain-containing protein n=1 Tax=Dibothriocephalus latus TaxID=60516 RepID=A0A3P7LIJ3_DIBLA|nr:unnamed protein product [Dibothriocephalus latus]